MISLEASTLVPSRYGLPDWNLAVKAVQESHTRRPAAGVGGSAEAPTKLVQLWPLIYQIYNEYQLYTYRILYTSYKYL